MRGADRDELSMLGELRIAETETAEPAREPEPLTAKPDEFWNFKSLPEDFLSDMHSPRAIAAFTPKMGESAVLARRSAAEDVGSLVCGSENSTEPRPSGSGVYRKAQSRMPAMHADIKFASVPTNISFRPIRARSDFLDGASAPIPPI
jgi:hypothetical protein